MTAPKPDLATAARQLNALVERMQREAAEHLGDAQPVGDFADSILRLLGGPEQRAAQGALKAALDELDEPKRLRHTCGGPWLPYDPGEFQCKHCGLVVTRAQLKAESK